MVTKFMLSLKRIETNRLIAFMPVETGRASSRGRMPYAPTRFLDSGLPGMTINFLPIYENGCVDCWLQHFGIAPHA
jgi:hypothetical protein